MTSIDELWAETLEVVAPESEQPDRGDAEYDQQTVGTPLHPSANVLMPVMAALAMFDRMREYDWRTVTEEEAKIVQMILNTIRLRIEEIRGNADACRVWHAWKDFSQAAPEPFRCLSCDASGFLSDDPDVESIGIAWCESCRAFVCSDCSPVDESPCRSCRQSESRNLSEADAFKISELEEMLPKEEMATLSDWINRSGRRSTKTKGKVSGKGRRIR